MSKHRKRSRWPVYLLGGACVAAIAVGAALMLRPTQQARHAEHVSRMLLQAAEKPAEQPVVLAVDADWDAIERDASGDALYRRAPGDDQAEAGVRKFWDAYDPAPELALPDDSSQLKLLLLGRMRIDRIGINEPVVEGCGYAQLHYAAGHFPTSAQPGEIGQCLIAGHRQYQFGKQFNRLAEIDYGDIIQFTTTGGIELFYCVDEFYLIAPGQQPLIENASYDDQARLTLLTCHPVFIADKRLIVKATRFDPSALEGLSADEIESLLPPPRPIPDFAQPLS